MNLRARSSVYIYMYTLLVASVVCSIQYTCILYYYIREYGGVTSETQESVVGTYSSLFSDFHSIAE